VNAKEKVLNAINGYNSDVRETERLEVMLQAQRQIVSVREQELLKTLKAVYGERAEKGVVYQGKRYAAVGVALAIENAEFEVLG
jgi:hypothetical protein